MMEAIAKVFMIADVVSKKRRNEGLVFEK